MVAHAFCSELNEATAKIVQSYDWQCIDCKSCLVCLSKTDEDKIVICNYCDRGYHTFCCNPLLEHIPEGDWYCDQCSSMPSPPYSPTKQQDEMIKVKLRLTLNPKIKRERKPKTARDQDDELYYKTFGLKLSVAEADIQRGIPSEEDKEKFEKALLLPEKNIATQQELSKISKISFGNYLIDTWYIAPYPEEYNQNDILYICEHCMKYMRSSFITKRHQKKCTVRYPPGNEVYRENKISIFEVDGRKNKIYCQNLCLMAKMFLDHKTLYYDVEPFLFYVMTEVDEYGYHFIGYFSKEKRSAMNYNVSCILTMPIYQRKGYGQFLIDFSYLLSKKEHKAGTPERPLSDLGLLSYRSYWKTTVFKELKLQKGPISIEDISNHTGLTPDDIISTLETNQMLNHDPLTNTYSIIIDPKTIEDHLNHVDQKGYVQVNPTKLTWTPFILSKDRLSQLLSE
ncbi:hypothetical protein G6F16_008324 [Rhizopus arrhizus]|nr:hypothetical protein G6F23_011444 [Rhizopus arrhizus]KAG0758472.1 hypothetical protein G6F24_009775 [Rhizopus arrhizus]KAG0781183.1 hypothetical protein G6F22_009698 [Rhizopus arrhizus]KAG0784657.1 hypothetical protein G6F21_009765 [Rhizopus arrhizus]KAG0810325.1 hypothetical protein G6F20_008050 [Rhizopus arrhizus]